MSGSGLTVEQVGLAPDHALIVLCGTLDPTTVAGLDAVAEQVLESGARYLVADLSRVSRCDPRALTALARVARRLSLREGWLRLVATSPAVVGALDTVNVSDLVALYHAHNGTKNAS